jgi:hypothetical protein
VSYTPEQLAAHVKLMHPGAHEDGTAGVSWLLAVGIGQGMLGAAADRIRVLERALTAICAESQDDGSIIKCGTIADTALRG